MNIRIPPPRILTREMTYPTTALGHTYPSISKTEIDHKRTPILPTSYDRTDNLIVNTVLDKLKGVRYCKCGTNSSNLRTSDQKKIKAQSL